MTRTSWTISVDGGAEIALHADTDDPKTLERIEQAARRHGVEMRRRMPLDDDQAEHAREIATLEVFRFARLLHEALVHVVFAAATQDEAAAAISAVVDRYLRGESAG